ncbi:hypothetical protein G647_00655 [Cladophialophora carrionii CBS 160.54]|uniref:HTH myb-type domain-containing protein n=1 Tax=Cladophialophora carrionii CBS 160.54 TaxID=1279043 RepID=V9DNF2_9EURO|nr:uncharacterized protein G647_00655 [Cladophialophora carrionii CBS 160.54]ETI28206.1 hypothetical protein G647_00655 [Cladophialophora carrionii CBS 160.54]
MAPPSRLRSTSRKNTPLSPPKAPSPVVAADASVQNRRRTRSASHDITAAQRDLQNVTTVLPAVNEGSEEVAPAQSRNVCDGFSSHGASSGSSSLQEVLDALDRDTIIDNLSGLYHDSTSLMSLLGIASDEQLREMCETSVQPAPRLHKRFHAQSKRFLLTRENYGTTHDGADFDFIQPDLILRKILGMGETDAIPNGAWRPDAVLYLANLALQIVNVLNPSVEVRRSYLEDMFFNFPQQFVDLQYFQPSPETYHGMCDLLVEMHTQVYLQMLELEQGHIAFDPETSLTAVFFDEAGQVKGSTHQPSRLKALDRCEFIRAYFLGDPPDSVDFAGLKDHFPWSDFAVKAVRWTLAVGKELEEFVDARGGIEKLVDLLDAGDFAVDQLQVDQEQTMEDNETERNPEDRGGHGDLAQIDAREDAGATTGQVNSQKLNNQGNGLEAEALETAGTRPTGAAQIPVGETSAGESLKSNMERLKALKALYAPQVSDEDADADTRSDSNSDPEVLRSPTPTIPDDYRVAGIGEEELPTAEEGANRIQDDAQDDAQDDGADEEILPTQQTKELLETLHRQRQQSNKENVHGTVKKASFLDRQEGAERLEWDDEFPDDGEIYPPRRPSPKRTIHQVESESGEDDEFETDTRNTKKPRMVVEKSPAVSSTRPGPQDAEDDEEEQESNHRKQAQPLLSLPRDGHPRPARRERMASPEPSRTTVLSSSQPERSSNHGPSSSRAPLRTIRSGSRDLPSSSAPARSDGRTSRVSSDAPSRDLAPSSQGQATSRLPSASQIPPSTEARQVNQLAKDMVRMARELQQNRRPAQIRRAYSPEEVDRLLDMIALYGTKWARILREDSVHPDGPVLQGRSQVQLKDKARNIKLDMLKAGVPLPDGFESVSVGNKKIEELRLLGIDYFEGTDAARYTGRGESYDDDDDLDD